MGLLSVRVVILSLCLCYVFSQDIAKPTTCKFWSTCMSSETTAAPFTLRPSSSPIALSHISIPPCSKQRVKWWNEREERHCACVKVRDTPVPVTFVFSISTSVASAVMQVDGECHLLSSTSSTTKQIIYFSETWLSQYKILSMTSFTVLE